MISINTTFTESTTCNGAQWKVIYHRQNGLVVCIAILLLYEGDVLYKTIEQPMPSEIYDAWGDDDSVVQDWLFAENNITT
jgi:hypothetical protein